MKVNFNTSAISQALSILTSVVPARTPKPILTCIKIEAFENNSVQISATDLEIAINYTISEVQVEQPGCIIVPASRLASIVRESLDDVISIEADDSSCEIKGSDSHFTIYGHDPQQYPQIPDFDGDADIKTKIENLQLGIDQTLFAAAKESTRYAINGVLWAVKGKNSLVATDGRRLAQTKVNLAEVNEQNLPKTSIIVPAKTMAILDKIPAEQNDIAQVRFTNNQVHIACANIVICSNLVDGNFPKYEDIIPKDYTIKITLNTEKTLSAVKRAALLTSEDSRGIKLALTENSLKFSARAPETGDAEVKMPIEYSGNDIEIGFSPQFLADVLRVIKSDTFDLELQQSDRPGLIKCGSSFLYVIMPISLG